MNFLELAALSRSGFDYKFIFFSATSLYTVQNYLSSDGMEHCSSVLFELASFLISRRDRGIHFRTMHLFPSKAVIFSLLLEIGYFPVVWKLTCLEHGFNYSSDFSFFAVSLRDLNSQLQLTSGTFSFILHKHIYSFN